MTQQVTDRRTGTRDEWLVARERLLVREKEHTRLGDELAQLRRELPWVPVEKEYRFDADDGDRALVELFDGRSQACSSTTSCSAPATKSGARSTRRSPTPSTVSSRTCMPETCRSSSSRRPRWRSCRPSSTAWAGASPVSSAHTDFNFDLGFSHTEEQGRQSLGADDRGRVTADRRIQRSLDGHRRRRRPNR